MTTRADPPLPLSRLRAPGELVEVRAADLRFTTDDAEVFPNEVTGAGEAISRAGSGLRERLLRVVCDLPAAAWEGVVPDGVRSQLQSCL